MLSSCTARTRRRSSASALVIEKLEQRCLLAFGLISPVEVHMHELINWVREYPEQAAARYATPLNQGLPPGTITADSKPPLARNDQLRLAIQTHLEDMQQHNYFSHTSLDGTTYVERIVAAGYTNWRTVGENIAWSGTTGSLGDLFDVAERLVGNWFRSPGHRNNLLRPAFKEAGSSFITGAFAPSGRIYNAGLGGQNFGTQTASGFLTGVGCLARHAEYDICDVTQPVPQASVTAMRQSDGLQRQTMTGANGEFDLQLESGTWDVEILAAGFQSLTFSNIAMAGSNVQLDFTPGAPSGPPPGPRTWTNPSQPLDVSGDGVVAPGDASLLIDSLNRDGARQLPPISAASPAPPPFYDPTGDNYLAPNDALLVINYLNYGAASGNRGRSLGINEHSMTRRSSVDLGVRAGELPAASESAGRTIVSRDWLQTPVASAGEPTCVQGGFRASGGQRDECSLVALAAYGAPLEVFAEELHPLSAAAPHSPRDETAACTVSLTDRVFAAWIEDELLSSAAR